MKNFAYTAYTRGSPRNFLQTELLVVYDRSGAGETGKRRAEERGWYKLWLPFGRSVPSLFFFFGHRPLPVPPRGRRAAVLGVGFSSVEVSTILSGAGENMKTKNQKQNKKKHESFRCTYRFYAMRADDGGEYDVL